VTLDAAAATAAAMQALVESGFAESTFWSNVKLALMTLASAVCLLAEFYPLPFPKNRVSD
jgi:hypothetical protein